MANPKTILITGANRGIGYSILQALATTTPTDQYIIAARSQKSIQEAISSLREDTRIRSTIQNTRIEGVVLDVTDDDSIVAAAESVTQRFGALHALVNNAGIAMLPTQDMAETREIYNKVLDANVTSVANVTMAFLPLLQATTSTQQGNGISSPDQTTRVPKPLVINISSGRASLTRSTTGGLPPTQSVPYSVSKVALNALTIELAKNHPDVTFQCANPGHCRTQLNGYRGSRDPLEGADVVVELVKRQILTHDHDEGGGQVGGFWETVGSNRELVLVPW